MSEKKEIQGIEPINQVVGFRIDLGEDGDIQTTSTELAYILKKLIDIDKKLEEVLNEKE